MRRDTSLGPYINAETTAGGIALWITSQVAGELRTNATDWKAAWQDYIQGIITETVPYQINQGGPVIGTQTLFDVLSTSLTCAASNPTWFVPCFILEEHCN